MPSDVNRRKAVTRLIMARDSYWKLQEAQILGRELDCSMMDECEDIPGRNSYICGSNGHTYESLCSFMRAFCSEREVEFKHHGECTASEKCLGLRRVALKAAKKEKGVYIPVCNKDGTFAAVQCHKDTKFCWCTTPAGSGIPGTAFYDQIPDCENLTGSSTSEASTGQSKGEWSKGTTETPEGPLIPDVLVQGTEGLVFSPIHDQTQIISPLNLTGDADRGRSKRRKKQKRPRGCEGSRRKTFNKNMLQNMLEGFLRINNETFVSGNLLQTATLKWKFGQLDTRPDGQLRRNEYKGIKKLVRQNIKPQKCARKFPKICDTNSDKKITLEEWIKCFSAGEILADVFEAKKLPNKAREKESERGHRLGNERIRKPYPNCEIEHRQALENYQNGNHDLYIPKCEENGRYRPVQCYGSADKNLWYCFCVNVITGEMIQNTSVQNVSPVCSSGLIPKPWPRCPTPEKEEKFLKSLMNYFSSYAKFNISRRYDSKLTTKGDKRVLEKVFNFFDKDNSGLLESKEKKKLRKIVQSVKRLRMCGQKIHIICDIDYDRKISSQEFFACILPRKYETNQNLVVQRATTRKAANKRPKGKNPFIEIIKSA